jgi:YD repeat-containing protein
VTISYYTKAQTANAHQRGRIADITDHLGHVLHFDYYHDGNLLRITQRGGTTASGAFMADRSWVFTYMTSNGSGPAILAAADRVDPDPKTPNEDAQIYSVRDPNGHESTYAYYLNSDGPALAGRVKSLTDRAGRTTGYSYNTATSTTTVTDPLSHATTYSYDASGRVTTITDPLGHPTQQAWTADDQLSKITEANSAYSTYTYNANGYLTDHIDQDGNHTTLTYLNQALDGTDTGTHWSLLATKTAPNGVAAGSGYQWQFGYDPAGNLLTATDPLGHTTSYCYNLAAAPACNPANDAGSPGTVEAVTDFNANTTRYANYDPNGQPQKVTDPLERVAEFGFEADGNHLWTQDPLHHRDTDIGPDPRSYRTYTDYDSFNPARPAKPAQIHHPRPWPADLDRHQLRRQRQHHRGTGRALRAAGRRQRPDHQPQLRRDGPPDPDNDAGHPSRPRRAAHQDGLRRRRAPHVPDAADRREERHHQRPHHRLQLRRREPAAQPDPIRGQRLPAGYPHHLLLPRQRRQPGHCHRSQRRPGIATHLPGHRRREHHQIHLRRRPPNASRSPTRSGTSNR